ncbi:MAG TPA: VWA domain-containing protein [Beijerinckiaceae bacterium]|jgi:hypothetical protein
MAGKRDVTRGGKTGEVTSSPGAAIDVFLDQARQVSPAPEGQPHARLVFALDATMSRQPTWDLACRVQGEMFETAASVGGLSVQLVYFRGFGECRASKWVDQPRALTALMTRIGCRGGNTQIGRVLRHVRNEAQRRPLKAFVYVGDAMEEPIDDLCSVAGELSLLGIKGFLFHEGTDPVAASAFQEIARLTGGAYARFDAAAPRSLAGLLRAAAAYASGGAGALERLASHDTDARKLLSAMGRGR